MIRLELEDREVMALRDVLRSHVGDLAMEIGATDEKEFRDDLKEQRRILRSLLQRLERMEEPVFA